MISNARKAAAPSLFRKDYTPIVTFITRTAHSISSIHAIPGPHGSSGQVALPSTRRALSLQTSLWDVCGQFLTKIGHEGLTFILRVLHPATEGLAGLPTPTARPASCVRHGQMGPSVLAACEGLKSGSPC